MWKCCETGSVEIDWASVWDKRPSVGVELQE